MRMRLAVVASHPIQYQAPWFRALAKSVDLTVFFCHRQDERGQADAGFGVDFAWDVPLLDGYTHVWLDNVARRPGVSTFGGCDTPGIYTAIRDGGFDACIVSGWYLKSYLQAIHACRQNAVPVFLRGDSHLGTTRRRLVSAVKYLPYRWLLRSVDGHLVVGQANRDYLRHYGVPEERLHFVPHFVDNAFFRQRADEARASGAAETIRRRAGAMAESTLVACVGKLTEGKRVGDVIEALARARQQGNDVRGLVVGSGAEQARLDALARERSVPVLFAGFQNQSQLPAFLAAADVLALPSGSETWGLVVNEAMACGVPTIVSSAVGCAADLVSDGLTGYVFPVGDVGALAVVIGEVARRQRTDPGAFKSAVRERIDRYSVDVAVSGTLRAIMAQRPHGSDRTVRSAAAR